MKKDIKDVFQEHLKHVTYDEKLYDKLKRFRLHWAQKSDDYIDFLGGNLIGVQPIRFSDNDEDTLYVDILGVDKVTLRSDIFELDGIDKNWKVSSNATYLTLGYIIHKFTKSTLPAKIKEDAIRETYYLFAYKAIGSLISHYFTYNIDIPTATAAYERLSNRYLIKRLGSWNKVFEHRAEDVLMGGLHYRRILTYTTDDATRTVADLQGRIREIVKNIFAILVEVKSNNEKVYSSSALEESPEGEVSNRELTDRPDTYILYTKSIIHSYVDFVNDDLIYLIKIVVPNIAEDKLVSVLKYISALSSGEIRDKHGKPLTPNLSYIEIIMTTTINYVRGKGITNNYSNHVMDILKHMKGYWSSSSVKDKDTLWVKSEINKYVKDATGNKTTWVLATLTLGVLLYVFLRGIYRNANK